MIKAGDSVVCVRDGSTWFQPSALIVGKIYTVQETMICCSSSRLWLHVGLMAAGTTTCPDCRKHHDNNGKIWFGSVLFCKVEERAIEKVIEYTVKMDIEIPEPVLS